MTTYQPGDETLQPLGAVAIAPLVVLSGRVPDADLARQFAPASPPPYRQAVLRPPEEPLTIQGFSAMYTRLCGPIERYVRHLFNINVEDAEDIAAGAFENALRAMHPGRVVSQPTDWMYQIAKRKAIDFVRHRRAVPMQSLSVPDAETGLPLADALLSPDDGETYADTFDQRQLLGYIFRNLPPKYATIIRLYDHEGYTHKDITHIMGITYSNSKTMLDRARSRARLLAAEYLSGQIVTKRRARLRVD